MLKILKLNSISPLADEYFENYEYSDAVKEPDGIMVRSAAMADYAVNDNLLAVARAGAGTNNIPSAEYAKKGIVVFNTPGANANAVKELVICELFLGGRKITDGIDWVKTLKGEGENVGKLVEKGKGKFVGREITGKTLGVIGLGAIGVNVANAAFALGMKVVSTDTHLSTKSALALSSHVKVVATAEEVLKQSDFVTVHIPLTPETRGMFNAAVFAQMKDGATLINNSRGELVNTDDVIEALNSGKLSRYITDFPDDKLIGVPNAICVPHLGASTPEAEDNCAVMAAKELTDYIEHGNIENSVNYPSLSMPESGAERLCVHHMNVKEILSKILTVISSQGINVENMQDSSKGEYAYLVCDLSDKLTAENIKKIADVEGVLRVRTI